MFSLGNETSGCKFTTLKNKMLPDKNSKGFSPLAQIGILLALTGVGMVLAGILSAGIWIAATHLRYSAMNAEMTNPRYYHVYMVIQAVNTFFVMFLPVILFARICYRKSSVYIGTKTPASVKQFLLVTAILLLVFPLGGALAELNRIIPIPKKWAIEFTRMENDRQAMENIFININTLPKYLLSLVLIGVLPAIFEEFYFRAGLQGILMRWFRGPAAAIIVTSILFSAIHISYYGFLVRFALGVVLGYVFYYSGSIWLSAFLHFLFNGFQVTALYFMKGSDSTKGVEENFPLWAGIPALIFLIAVFGLFKMESERVHRKFRYKEPDDPHDIQNWIANN